MDSDSTAVLSKLQSGDLAGIHRLAAAHLHPFTPLLKPPTKKPPAKSSKAKRPPEEDPPPIRRLAKQFLSFIHKALSLLPKRLSESPKIACDSALELFDVYRLCLDCLDLIAPELSGKPHSVKVQRLRYMHCLEHWEMYREAEDEGFAVLESMNEVVGGAGTRKSKGRYVPVLVEGNAESEIAVIVLELVVTLVKCVSKRKSKVGADYLRVISLVNESEPWFRILDAKNYEKFHHFLETNLHITALFLVSEIKNFGVQLICDFALLTFKEYTNSHSQDQMYKFALKICSSLFSQRDDLSSDIILDVVQHVLDFTAAELKVGVEKTNLGFFEIVCYCANKCHSVTASLCSPVAEHLYRLAHASHEDCPFISSILRLYATGLLAGPSNDHSKGEEKENCRIAPLGSSFQALIYNKERLQQLAACIKLLNDHYGIAGKEKTSQQEGISLSPYWEALKFLCQALAESMYRNRKEFFSEAESCWDDLKSIHDVFHQFCYIFLKLLSATDRERETAGDNHRLISVVVVAALMLSFKTNQNIKESTLLVKHIISAEWVPVKRLKYLYVSLNNIAVILNRKKRLKEAIKALKLCCKASWNYVVDLCKMRADKSHASHDGLSEDAIADFAREASEKTAFLLELKQEGNCKIDGVVKESLKCWSISENLVGTLPIPVSLVKEWVKIQSLLSKDAVTDHGTTLYSLLSASKEISRKALGKLLEQELLACDERSYLDPTYCLRVRLQIINVLLEKVYNKDNNLKKSEILIEKGKVLKAHGSARVDECMLCLSDAISTLKLIYSAKRSCSYRVHHLLICAYILHALWIHEAVPNSLVISPGSDFHADVHAALNLCLTPDHGHVDGQYEDMLYLWYQLIDLLSLKGYLEFHPRLYDVVIKLFNEKSFSVVKTVAELWRNRRLSHALCASPVNHMFVDTFSNHQSQICNAADFWTMCMEELKPLVVGFHQINNEIKQAASNLISQVPQTSCSIFLSSNLYFDLSGRLISSGCMIEALAYAKEAHRLRSKLLQQNFEYSVEKMTETFSENGNIIERNYYGIQNFKVRDFAVTKSSRDSENCILTPWNVLSCYLESVLQVAFVHEILGNVSEAEMLLRWGRNVSQFQGLPLIEISFSSMLGKLYHKQRLWNIAENELSSAKKILADNLDVISCKRCSCMLEISINQQMGDLFLGSSRSTGESPSIKKLVNAKSLYKSVLEKINRSDWSASYSTSEESKIEQYTSRETSLSSVMNTLQINNDTLSNGISETKIEPRRSRRTKKEQKPASQRQDIVHAPNRRRTRSTHRSSGEPREILPDDRQTGPASGVLTEHMSAAAVGSHCNMPNSQYECFATDFQSDVTSLSNKMKCWSCLHSEAVDQSSLNNFIYLNWELVYRKHCLRLLISIGKFYGICGNVHDAHEILLQSASVLFSRNPYCRKHSSDSLVFLIESIGKDFPRDALAVEHAALLYYICWFALKSYTCPSKRNGNICSELLCIGTIKIVSLLKQSFILCREVPLLSQKISRLLAAVYVLSTSLKQFSLPPNKKVSECQWASFFHQSSLGTHLNQQILSGLLQSKLNQTPGDSEDSFPSYSVSTIPDLPGSLRPAPESCEDLEEFVLRFFQGLPSTPIICISIVTDVDASLLGELLQCSPTVRAFILLSHLSSDNQHVILLPVYETLGASNDDASSSSVVFNCKDVVKQWQCPWVSSVVDDIAPVFRHILEGNYYSSSEYFLECINENTSLWWMHRKRLDDFLGKFLQDVEDLWLGTWKYLLLGEWPDCTLLHSIEKDLSEDDRHLLQLVVTKRCYISQRPEASHKSSNALENVMQLLFKRKVEVSDNFDQVDRKPIILVLDSEVQMLPWESLPILRNQEVYRMPSVGNIFTALGRCCQNQERFQTNILSLPSIDPLDSYYLLNPDGDLNRTQVEFENWFKDQRIEGKIGTVPTIEELTLALKNHDLFIYFGHGSGTQYIPGHEIQKLDGCAASLLLGCSSGSLYLKGSYMPQGAPISYLLAGSPVIVANLWEVTDKDIDRFGKAMLNGWLRERSVSSPECNNRRRIASFMGQAREACTLGFLIGAAPVCYGVPTEIIKRKNL